MSVCENENCKKKTVVIYITDHGKLCSECNDILKRRNARKVILRKRKVLTNMRKSGMN